MQQIIVIIIGIVVFGYVAYSIYKTVTKKPSDNKCDGCNGGCDVY